MSNKASEILSIVSALQVSAATGLSPAQLFADALEHIRSLTGSNKGAILRLEDNQFTVLASESVTGFEISSPVDPELNRCLLTDCLLTMKQTPLASELLSIDFLQQTGPGDNVFVHPLHGRDQTLGVLILMNGEKLSESDIKDYRPVFDLTAAYIQGIQNEKSDAYTDNKLQHIIDAVTYGIITVTPDGLIQQFSRGAEKLFGYREKYVLGISITDMLDPASAEVVSGVLASTEGFSSLEAHEVTGIKKDESTFPISLGIQEIDFHDTRRFVVSVHDLTQFNEKQNELIAARDSAEAARQSLSSFVQSMGHELRTPLNAITTFSMLLKDQLAGDAEGTHKIDQVIVSSNHLLNLINDIFDFSIIESKKIVLSPKLTNPTKIIDECITMLQERAQAKSVSIHLDRMEDCQIQVDPGRLTQIILNLITNAIKYNKPGGEVHISCEPITPSRVKISVTDTGIGIPYHKQSEVFTPFNRLGAEQSVVEGTGIGLSLSRQLALLMNGSLAFTSEPEFGSCFWLEFRANFDQQPDFQGLPGNDRTYLDHANLLYIEDNNVNIMVMQAIVDHRENISLTCAESGEEGIQICADNNFDVVLCDINLPDLSGFDVLRKIRERKPDLPVIAVSASAMSQEISEGEKAGFDSYITKPIDIHVFWSTVEKALRNRSQIDHID